MSSTIQFPYEPDFVTPPGEMLAEKLDNVGMSQADLAVRIGHTRKMVNELLKGKAPLLPDTALKLEHVLGMPARFWTNAEANYRQHLAREQETRRLAGEVRLLDELPVKQLVRSGWLPARSDPASRMREVLGFFGVASPEALRGLWKDRCLAFRRSLAHKADGYALLAWLRMGELQAQEMALTRYDRKAFRSALTRVRSLVPEPVPAAIPAIRQMCAAAGVAFTLIPELAGCRSWGVTQWVNPERAILQLSLRGKTDDQFWFTFFHEAAHILLHSKKEIYVETDSALDEREQEANRFAREMLIPPREWRRLAAVRPRSARAVESWAAQLNLAPGVLVGCLQHEELLPWAHLNGLKARLRFQPALERPASDC